MKIVFVSNFLNHHQVPLAEEFCKIDDVEYKFIAMEPLPESFRKSGYPDYSEKSYLVMAYKDEYTREHARSLIFNADVVVAGQAPEEMILDRIKANKLTFRYSERWFKKHPWFLTPPKNWLQFYKNHIRYKDNNLYMLAAGAFVANDMRAIGAYKDKIYKWGYFPQVEVPLDQRQISGTIRIMWCARLIDWKHPELPVKLASKLKKEGYNFVINMYGSGYMMPKIEKLIMQLNVEDSVRLCGNCPNEQILAEMRNHDIFLFTSDKQEGWGAVLNEAMSAGCCVIASDEIGAVPYLLEDNANGLIFKSRDIHSLFEKTKKALDDKSLIVTLSDNAKKTMAGMWNAKVAAERLIQLINTIKGGGSNIYFDGPCSKAFPYNI